MDLKSPLLQVGKKDIAQQTMDLKSFLGRFVGNRLHASECDPGIDADACSSSAEDDLDLPPAKRRCRLPEPPTSSDSEYDSEPDTDAPSPCQSEAESENDISFDGNFTCQGETVAVYYDQQLFIGEVLEVHSLSKATVTFMGQDSDSNSFFWPSSLDLDEVDSKYDYNYNLS